MIIGALKEFFHSLYTTSRSRNGDEDEATVSSETEANDAEFATSPQVQRNIHNDDGDNDGEVVQVTGRPRRGIHVVEIPIQPEQRRRQGQQQHGTSALIMVKPGFAIAKPEFFQCERTENSSIITHRILHGKRSSFSLCLFLTTISNTATVALAFLKGPQTLVYPHVWFGLILIGMTVCLYWNSTVITISPNRIDLHVRPLGFGLNCCNRSVVLVEDEDDDRNASPSTPSPKQTPAVREIQCQRNVDLQDGTATYHVNVVRIDGSSDWVRRNLKFIEEALFLAQEIKRIMSSSSSHTTTSPNHDDVVSEEPSFRRGTSTEPVVQF